MLKIAVLFGVASGLFSSAVACAASYYVSPGGADREAGSSLEHPFATIQRAAEIAEAGDTVFIRSGTYRETVRPNNSGTKAKPIVFRPFENAVVVVDGADLISGWKPLGDGLWAAPLAGDAFKSSFNQSDQIFVDGQMMTLARWPNTGSDVSRPTKESATKFVSWKHDQQNHWYLITFEDDKLDAKTAAAAVGAEIYIQPNEDGWGWTVSGTVDSIQGKQITIRTRNGSSKDGAANVYADHFRYYLFNKRELLDAPGEWFHDRQHGLLYLKSPDSLPLTSHQVEAKRRDFAFDLSERSNITIQGIHLFACTITTDANACGDGQWHNSDGSERFPWRGTDFVAAASNITIDGVNAKYLNHYTDVSGHFFLSWPTCTGIVLSGSDCVIRNCRVQFSAGNGISLQGKNHRCLNNVVLDTNYNSTDCAAISTGPSTKTFDCEIANNTVNRTARIGVSLRTLLNSDPAHLRAEVHHNDIMNYGMQDWDIRAFYAFGQASAFVRIDHNWFHCDEPRVGMVNGAYFDFSKDYVLDHNVVWGVCTPMQFTHEFDPNGAKINNMLVYNNTFITNDAQWGRAFYGDTNSGSLIKNNIIKAAAFKDPKGTLILRWPNYGSAGPEVVRNLLYGAPKTPGWTEGNKGSTDLIASDAGFADAARHDFRLAPGSPAIGAGAPVGIQTRDGITVPDYSDAPPGKPVDLGAYQSGLDWKAGSTLEKPEDLVPESPHAFPG